MTWIDYKKAFDSVAQRWMIDCLKMYSISNEVIKFFENAMKNWRVELTAEEKILRWMFHLMYMDDIKLFAKHEKELETLIQAVRICSQYIRTVFGIENVPHQLWKAENDK